MYFFLYFCRVSNKHTHILYWDENLKNWDMKFGGTNSISVTKSASMVSEIEWKSWKILPQWSFVVRQSNGRSVVTDLCEEIQKFPLQQSIIACLSLTDEIETSNSLQKHKRHTRVSFGGQDSSNVDTKKATKKLVDYFSCYSTTTNIFWRFQ